MPTSTLTKSNYVPLSQIDIDNKTYHFRFESNNKLEGLKEDISKLGQLTPITLLESTRNRYIILDGHRRCQILKEDSEEVSAQIISKKEFTTEMCFRLLVDKNFFGKNAYGLCEKSLFFEIFRKSGLRISDMAKTCSISVHDIEDYLVLSQAPLSLAKLINETSLEPIYIVMLLRRYLGWDQSTHSIHADKVVQNILTEAGKDKTMSMKKWRFYLDFYWGNNKPFMA